MQRDIRPLAFIAAAFFIACGAEPPASPAPPQPPAALPTAAAPAPAAGQKLTGDTPQETAGGGATFTAPAGWTLQKREGHVLLEGPEPDLHIAIVEAQAPGAEVAVSKAWRVLYPDFKRPLKLATPGAARHGWEERHDFTYETSPNEKRVVLAQAYRRGAAWTVLLIDAEQGAFERRHAQFRLIRQSLRPRDYVKESFAGKPAQALDADRVQQITGMLDRAREITGVPGLAVSLVQGGKVVFQGGLGVRELGKAAKVDESTLFLIASNTKALTTLLLAKLVDEGKLQWDAPVKTVYPPFELGDPATTNQVLVKHLICACTGLPRQDLEGLFEFEKVTPQGVMELLGTFQPTTRFGEVYQYSNLLAAAAGYVGGAVAYPGKELGAAYDEAMRTRVFEPLGMKDTTFDFARALRGNHATPHAEDVDGKTTPATMAVNRLSIPDRPNGGAWSSAKDLTRYVQMELAKGELPGGTRLLSQENLLARREKQVAMGESAIYGMGLMVDTEWGIPVVHHGGFLIGFRSDMFWLPEHGVGGVLLTNADNGAMLLGAFVRKTLEVLFDGKPEAEEDIAVEARAHEAEVAKTRERLVLPPAKDVVATLARRYRSPALGDLEVHTDGDKCVFDFGAWKSPVATRKNDDGTTTMFTTEPGLTGLEFVISERGGKRALVLRDKQHEYTFIETP